MSERLVLKPGASITAGNRHYRIHRILDLGTVVAHDIQSGEVTRLQVSALASVIPETAKRPPPAVVDLVWITDEEWKIAQERFAVIRPLLATSHGTRAQATEHARLAGVTTATVYRWLQRYQRSGCVSCFLLGRVVAAAEAD
jgi:putative transposase